MYIHEYQAKELLAEFGVVVPRGTVAHTPEEAENAAGAADCGPWMVKAQIHAGGRGKGGGAKLCKTPADVRAAAAAMLGMTLVTLLNNTLVTIGLSASWNRFFIGCALVLIASISHYRTKMRNLRQLNFENI